MAQDMEIDALLPLPIQNAAFAYLAYDEYRLGEHGVHYEDVIPMDKFVMMNHMVDHSRTHMRADENGLLYFPGETDPTVDYIVASDKAKKFSWSLVDALLSNEKRGICFEDFGWDNVCVSRSSGKVKFRNVALREGMAGTDFLDQLGRNFINGRDIILQVFLNDVPADIADLLHVMEHDFDGRSLFGIHPSLVPMANHSGLFKDLYDTAISVVPVADTHDILLQMRAVFPQYMQNWRALVASNDLLSMTYGYRGGVSYAIPHNRLGQRIEQRTMLRHLRITPPQNRKILHPHEFDLIEPLQLLLFLRNRPAHRLEHYGGFLLGHADEDFNSLGSERVSHGRFPLILIFLTRELDTRGFLGRIPAASMFY